MWRQQARLLQLDYILMEIKMPLNQCILLDLIVEIQCERVKVAMYKTKYGCFNLSKELAKV